VSVSNVGCMLAARTQITLLGHGDGVMSVKVADHMVGYLRVQLLFQPDPSTPGRPSQVA
jgi:hypothetical protein